MVRRTPLFTAVETGSEPGAHDTGGKVLLMFDMEGITGATKAELEPTKTLSPIMVLVFKKPS